jgi:hypothetical protein
MLVILGAPFFALGVIRYRAAWASQAEPGTVGD